LSGSITIEKHHQNQFAMFVAGVAGS